MLTGGKAVIKPLLVIDRKGGCLLLFEGAEANIFTALLLEFHTLGDHLAYGQAGANLVEERLVEAHGLSKNESLCWFA